MAYKEDNWRPGFDRHRYAPAKKEQPMRKTLRAALILTGSLVNTTVSVADKPANDDDARARIDKRVETWQPTMEERRLDEVGWASDIRDALRLAKQHQRPIFLFTYSGSADREHAMALQRC
jgi:hypothetical protein